MIVNALVFNNPNLTIDLHSSTRTFYQQDVIELKENIYQYQWIGISNSTEEIDSEAISFSGAFSSNLEFFVGNSPQKLKEIGYSFDYILVPLDISYVILSYLSYFIISSFFYHLL